MTDAAAHTETGAPCPAVRPDVRWTLTPFYLAAGLAVAYVLAVAVGPAVARHAGDLAAETGPVAWAVGLSGFIVGHRVPVAVGLGAFGLGLSVSAVAWPWSRRPAAVVAAAVLAFDVLFLAFLPLMHAIADVLHDAHKLLLGSRLLQLGNTNGNGDLFAVFAPAFDFALGPNDPRFPRP